MSSKKSMQKKRATKKQGGSKRKLSKTMSRKMSKKRTQKGGECGCNQKHFVGGYGVASFQGDPSKYTYAYNTHDNDPIAPSNVTNARNLSGGSKLRRKRIGGGGIFPDLLGKSSGSDFYSSTGTSNAAQHAAQMSNGQTPGAGGPFPTQTSMHYNTNYPTLV